jgi:hypothetical protein
VSGERGAERRRLRGEGKTWRYKPSSDQGEDGHQQTHRSDSEAHLSGRHAHRLPGWEPLPLGGEAGATSKTPPVRVGPVADDGPAGVHSCTDVIRRALYTLTTHRVSVGRSMASPVLLDLGPPRPRLPRLASADSGGEAPESAVAGHQGGSPHGEGRRGQPEPSLTPQTGAVGAVRGGPVPVGAKPGLFARRQEPRNVGTLPSPHWLVWGRGGWCHRRFGPEVGSEGSEVPSSQTRRPTPAEPRLARLTPPSWPRP